MDGEPWTYVPGRCRSVGGKRAWRRPWPAQHRQVDQRAEAEHGHDVAAEVRLWEQPPRRRAHRLLLDGGGPAHPRPAAACSRTDQSPRTLWRVYRQRPLPQQRGARCRAPPRSIGVARAYVCLLPSSDVDDSEAYSPCSRAEVVSRSLLC